MMHGTMNIKSLDDSYAAFVAIALVICLINEKNRRWMTEWYGAIEDHNTHTNMSWQTCMLSEPNY